MFIQQLADLINVCHHHGAFIAEIREEKANKEILDIRQTRQKTFVIGSGSDQAKEGTWIWASDGQVFSKIGGYDVDDDDDDDDHTMSRSRFRSMTPYANFGNDWPKWDTKANCLVIVRGGVAAGTWQSKPCNTG